MTNLGKIFAVVAATAGLAFAALAMVLTMGGVNWQGEINVPPLGGQQGEFLLKSEITTEGTKHSLSQRATGMAVGSAGTKNLAELVVAARKRLKDDLSQQQQRVDQAITALRGVPEAQSALIAKDLQGVAAREEAWAKQLDLLQKELANGGQEFNDKATELRQARSLGEERREERDRLVNQLDLLRTDLFAAERQLQSLENEVLVLEQLKARLTSRRAELIEAR